MAPSYVMTALIISGLLAISGVLLSFYIVYNLRSKKSDFQATFQNLTIAAVILFTFCNVFAFIYCIWMYIDFDEDLEDGNQSSFEGYPIHLCQVFVNVSGQILVLILCNSRLYYTFNTIPGLRISKRLYYTMNTLIALLPLLIITAYIGVFISDSYLQRVGFDSYRFLYIALMSCIAFMFNKKLYKKTMDRRTIRNFKIQLKEMGQTQTDNADDNVDDDWKDSHFEFMRSVTGRDDDNYQSMRNENEFDNSVYILLDMITRYSLLVFFINLSIIAFAVISNIFFYLMDNNAVSLMFPMIYGSFNAVLNSFCLFLFYSYGDAHYQLLCQCNKNKKCKYCALHYCAEKCCWFSKEIQYIVHKIT
eukprot:520144_1